jgi:hypothetical protein
MRAVHIRRALLLFAIVLGMAALVASLSRPPDERSRTERRKQAPTGPAIAEPAPADAGPKAVSFDAALDERRRQPASRALTLEVSVDEPGSVALPGFGLNASADEHTPARFDVFTAHAGRYEILFTPARGDETRRAGTLVVD